MKLTYYRDKRGNFGDDLNPWLWERLLPGFLDGRDDVLFVAIGTILNHAIPQTPIKVVFGSGVGYGTLPIIDDRWRFYAVRGPLSAARLGLPPETSVTDPAALVATVFQERPRRRGVSLMPHHESGPRFDWASFCRRLGIRFLDPAMPIGKLLREIARSELVLAEAMHAAIVADAFRVPWVPLRLNDHINEFKWQDWCASLDLTCEPASIAPLRDNSRQRTGIRLREYLRRVRRTGSLTRHGKPPAQIESNPKEIAAAMAQLDSVRTEEGRRRLSSEAVLDDRIRELQERLERIRSDWTR
jgi:succinoglycan biosynthesis protein ExoV